MRERRGQRKMCVCRRSVLGDLNGGDDDRLNRLVARAGLDALDRRDDVHALDNLPEDRVLRRGRRVKIVEEGVVLPRGTSTRVVVRR